MDFGEIPGTVSSGTFFYPPLSSSGLTSIWAVPPDSISQVTEALFTFLNLVFAHRASF